MKISLSILFNYFSVSGDSEQKKISNKKSGTLTTTRGVGGRPLCGGHHPKVPLFLDAAPYVIQYEWSFLLLPSSKLYSNTPGE